MMHQILPKYYQVPPLLLPYSGTKLCISELRKLQIDWDTTTCKIQGELHVQDQGCREVGGGPGKIFL
jgi:hypothetical protein